MHAESRPNPTAAMPRVAYLGPPSSYTHQATVDNFDSNHFELDPQTTIADVFEAVQEGSATYGVVPFENSSNGAVVQTLDLFGNRAASFPDIHVIGETYVAVHHCLLGFSDGSSEDPESGEATPTRLMPSPARSKVKPRRRVQHVKKVYSHPQAFGQCEAFLSVHLRNAERQEVSSTSKAAQLAAEDATKMSAAISSRMAADVHDLEVLASGIEDRPDNETRFFILKSGGANAPPDTASATPTFMKGADAHEAVIKDGSEGEKSSQRDDGFGSWKTLVSLTINHGKAGALSQVLDLFRDADINLSSINTRPTRARPWNYVFLTEFEGKMAYEADGRVTGALSRLNDVTESCRWHGSWRKRGGV